MDKRLLFDRLIALTYRLVNFFSETNSIDISTLTDQLSRILLINEYNDNDLLLANLIDMHELSHKLIYSFLQQRFSQDSILRILLNLNEEIFYMLVKNLYLQPHYVKNTINTYNILLKNMGD